MRKRLKRSTVLFFSVQIKTVFKLNVKIKIKLKHITKLIVYV